MSEPRSVSVTADGLRYTGLEWGPQDGEPIMALHGWLDNALSFSVVAPKLEGYRVIALDLSGQGFSDHRSPDATYHIWDDIPQLLSVADQLGFEKLAVAGHSRGERSQCYSLLHYGSAVPISFCWTVCCLIR